MENSMSSLRPRLYITPQTKIHLINMAVASSLSYAHRLVAQAKLAANSSAWDWADGICGQLVNIHNEAGVNLNDLNASLSKEEISQIEASLFMCSRFDLLSLIVKRKYKLRYALEFCVSDANVFAGQAKFSVRSDKSGLITVDQNIFSKADPEVFIRRLMYIIPIFCGVLRLESLEEGSVYVDLSDQGDSRCMSFCGHDMSILIPDAVFLNERGYERLKNIFLANPVNWSDRKAVVFWRGSTTGWTDAWQDLPRIKLCQWALHSPHRSFLDVRISDVVQRSPDDVLEIQASGVMGGHVPDYQFADYKYHIDIDGNTNSWPGLFTKLLSGSPVLKVDSLGGFRQWYYDKLIPWGNFVPVRSDLSNLDEIIEWLVHHDDEAKQIGERGRALALDLSFESQVEYGANVIKTAMMHGHVAS